jgi:hypothetical protein
VTGDSEVASEPSSVVQIASRLAAPSVFFAEIFSGTFQTRVLLFSVVGLMDSKCEEY